MPGPSLGADIGGVENIARVIQVAITPVFLLSAVGALLNVFNARLSRVRDHAEHIAESLQKEQEVDRPLLHAHLRRLHFRTIALDVSVMLMAVAGAATCGAAFALFFGALRTREMALGLEILFGIALMATVGALTAFVGDTVLAWHGLRVEGALPRPKTVVRT